MEGTALMAKAPAGGIFLCYVPTIVQSQQIAETCNAELGLVETFETLYRPQTSRPVGPAVPSHGRPMDSSPRTTVSRDRAPDARLAVSSRRRRPLMITRCSASAIAPDRLLVIIAAFVARCSCSARPGPAPAAG
jgi:hypothetical protein